LINKDLKAIYFFGNAGVVIVFSYIALLMDQHGLNETEIALLALPFSITQIVSSFIFGRLSDRMGRRLFLLIGFSSSIITTLIYLLANSSGTFLFVRALHGISLGIYPASIIGVASDRKAKIGNLTSFGSLGWAFGGYFGGVIAEVLNLESAFLFSAMMFTMSFLILLVFNTAKDTDNIRKASNIVIPYEAPKLNKYKISLQANWHVYSLVILRHGTANSIWVFWALFLIKDLGVTTSFIGIIQATNMITQFVVMRTIGDRNEPVKMIIVGSFLSVIAFYSFTLTNNMYVFLLTQVILGTSWAFFYVGCIRTIEFKSRPYDSVGTATGIFQSSISASQLLGPLLAIIFFQIYQTYTLSMKLAALITLISTIFFILVEFKIGKITK
jgi:MFS transporter, DHA1 family, multidrug resistance protein